MRLDLPARGLHLEAECHGDPEAPAIILVMGLGLQLIAWPEELIQALTEAGYRVVVFDNRDCGLSGTSIQPGFKSPRKALLASLLRRPFCPPYDLSDMAEDTLALADALGIETFHLVGISLGGMVAQTLAAQHPDRVKSLVSIMSNAGPDTAPWPKLRILRRFLRPPPRRGGTRARVKQTVGLLKALGRLTDPAEIERLQQRVEQAVQRAYRPDGVARQMLATLVERDRTDQVARIRCPVLIVHGRADPLIRLPAALHLQKTIPHARLAIVEGMGHYLPQSHLPEVIRLLTAWNKSNNSCGQRSG